MSAWFVFVFPPPSYTTDLTLTSMFHMHAIQSLNRCALSPRQVSFIQPILHYRRFHNDEIIFNWIGCNQNYICPDMVIMARSFLQAFWTPISSNVVNNNHPFFPVLLCFFEYVRNCSFAFLFLHEVRTP